MNPSKLFQIAVLYSTFGLGGCGHDAHGHDHGDEHDPAVQPAATGHRPHYEGGFLVEAGEHAATIEFVPDLDEGRLYLHLYDGCADEAQRSAMERVLLDLELEGGTVEVAAKAQADALSGEKVGDSATFLVEDDALRGAEHVRGRVREITFLGRTFKDVAFDTDPATHREGYFGGRSDHAPSVVRKKDDGGE